MARKEQSQLDKDRRINDIIIATKKILIEKGYFKTTMGDISQESGLSRRTLYLYFKSKEEISLEIVKQAFKSLENMVINASETKTTGYKKLESIKKAYLEYYKSNFSEFYFTIFFDFKINTQIIQNKDAKECFSTLSSIVDVIENCIIEGIKDGSISANIENTRKRAIAILNLVHGTMQKMAVRKEIINKYVGFSTEQLIDETFQILFQSF